MISVTLDKPDAELSYPRLMKCTVDGSIVLFVGDKDGTVVHEGKYGWMLGHASDDWDMSCFVDYSGSVTLSNGG